MKNLKLFIIFLILGIAISIGYIVLGGDNIIKQKSNIKVQTSNAESFNIAEAPKNSLRGKITSMTGEVKWQSRIATEPATIKEPQIVQQGEDLVTGDDGIANLEFASVGTISMSPKSHLSIVQTLPVNLVFGQPDGEIDYIKLGGSPISIRSYTLLITISEGETNISIDKDRPLIKIIVKKGYGQVAFNDLNNTSNLISIKEDNTYVYNQTLRSFISE